MDVESLERKLSESTVYSIIECKDLTDEEYESIRWVMESFGGRWNEKCKGFKFDSLNDELMEKIKESIRNGGVTLDKEKAEREHDAFFPTPIPIVDKMIDLADVHDGDRVLDSSAGTGRIIHRVLERNKVYSVALEPNSKRFGELRSDIDVKQMTTFEGALSFERFKRISRNCNKVIINPPFKNDMDIKHLLLSYLFCADNADVVCIIQENSLYYNRKVHRLFNMFLSFMPEDSIEFSKLPSGSFKSELTTVDTVMVHIKKNIDTQRKADGLLRVNCDILLS